MGLAGDENLLPLFGCLEDQFDDHGGFAGAGRALDQAQGRVGKAQSNRLELSCIFRDSTILEMRRVWHAARRAWVYDGGKYRVRAVRRLRPPSHLVLQGPLRGPWPITLQEALHWHRLLVDASGKGDVDVGVSVGDTGSAQPRVGRAAVVRSGVGLPTERNVLFSRHVWADAKDQIAPDWKRSVTCRGLKMWTAVEGEPIHEGFGAHSDRIVGAPEWDRPCRTLVAGGKDAFEEVVEARDPSLMVGDCSLIGRRAGSIRMLPRRRRDANHPCMAARGHREVAVTVPVVDDRLLEWNLQVRKASSVVVVRAWVEWPELQERRGVVPVWLANPQPLACDAIHLSTSLAPVACE